MKNVELKIRVRSVASNILKENNYISPVEMLIKIGVLSVKDYESWRFGRMKMKAGNKNGDFTFWNN